MDGDKTPDFIGEFEKANRANFAKGYAKLKEIAFGLFTDHSDLPDAENLAITKDMINAFSNIRYNEIIDLWFTEWKSRR